MAFFTVTITLSRTLLVEGDDPDDAQDRLQEALADEHLSRSIHDSMTYSDEWDFGNVYDESDTAYYDTIREIDGELVIE